LTGLGIILFATAVAVGGILIFRSREPDARMICGGVGLDGAIARTPEDALAQAGGAEQWVAVDRSSTRVTYRPRDKSRVVVGYDFSTLVVEFRDTAVTLPGGTRSPATGWQMTGACV
jgi:hypothetical protein